MFGAGPADRLNKPPLSPRDPLRFDSDPDAVPPLWQRAVFAGLFLGIVALGIVLAKLT